ncbi:MAG: hypothetical protein IV101_16595 [Dechloromonas sp.]|uniref:hypothetical protein n=1 Tax=Dechloromonas sp. TaxID=1917218 RepID=UPI0027FE01F8|nr:hypothetical protein [Dechloromonas sp.]MBT9522494.1 hypothetical protein [Dechloromonas sp.]
MSSNFVEPQEFFRLLHDDIEFCSSLGRVMLTAGMLETNLRRYLDTKAVKFTRKDTLGALVNKLKQANLLTENGKAHFSDLTKKRNYLAHNLYGLFSKELEATILPRVQLVSVDTALFIEKAESLAEDFVFFANLVAKADKFEDKLL